MLRPVSSVTQTIRLATNAPYYAGYFQDDYRLTSKTDLEPGVALRMGSRTERAKQPLRCRVRSKRHQTRCRRLQVFQPRAVSNSPVKTDIPQRAAITAGRNFGPRIGAAYALNPKTTIRLGYGTFYAPSAFTSSSAFAPGYSQATTYVYSNDGGKTPAGSLSDPYPGGILAPSGNANGYLTGVGSSVTNLVSRLEIADRASIFVRHSARTAWPDRGPDRLRGLSLKTPYARKWDEYGEHKSIARSISRFGIGSDGPISLLK